jgi:hypothetical protein
LTEDAAPESQLGYFVFGSHERTFAAHRLTTAAGFDEILRVTLDGDAPSDDELAIGVDARIVASDEVSQRLGARSTAANAIAGEHSFTIEKQTELSCVEGPDFTNACP